MREEAAQKGARISEEIKQLLEGGLGEIKISEDIYSSISPAKPPWVKPFWKPVGKEPRKNSVQQKGRTGPEDKETQWMELHTCIK